MALEAPEDAVEVGEDVFVPEAAHAVASSGQAGCAPGIGGFIVLPAIKLDEKHRIRADEIGDVRADRHLPPEFEPVQPTISRSIPEGPLGIRHIAPKLPRVWTDSLVTTLLPLPPAGEGWDEGAYEQ